MNIALKPFLKAVTPALVGLATMVISWVATGEWSSGELGILLAGLVTSAGTYIVPNIASTPFLKALVAPVLGVVAVGARALEVGPLDVTSLRLSVAGVLTGALVFAVPNVPRDTGDLARVARWRRESRDGLPGDYAGPGPVADDLADVYANPGEVRDRL